MESSIERRAGADFLSTATMVTTFADCAEAYLEEDLEVYVFPRAAPFVGGVLPWVDGDTHRMQRKLGNRLFTRKALSAYENELLSPAISRGLAEVAEKSPPGDVPRADLLELVSTALIRISAGVVGIDGIDDRDRARELLHVHNVMLEALTARWSTRSLEELEREGLLMKQHFIKSFYEPARRRREALIAQEAADDSQSEAPLDLITVMLREESPEWDADFPVRLCINMLVASVSSTASSLVHLVDDLTTWLADHPEDGALAFDSAFLRGAINESLRLHPVTPAQVRCATRDLRLPGGRSVQAGEVLALVTGAANRDRQAFGDDADEFDPRRHQRLTRRVPPYGLVFGYGRHLCLGKPLVTTATQSGTPDEHDLQRTSMRVIRSLMDAGIERDPEDPAVHAQTHMERYTRYPVILRSLRQEGGATP